MCAYLEEAAQLAAAVPQNRCPTTDAIDYLDAHPNLRLALEDTWSDPRGRVYREVPADRRSRWPVHLSKAFRSLLRISRQPEQVFQLLDLLHALDASPEVVRMTLAGCRRRKSLQQALTYYAKLNDELAEVTRDRPAEEVSLGTLEPRCRPRLSRDEVATGPWYLPDSVIEAATEDRSPPYWRPQLIHDPNSHGDCEIAWMTRQPRAFRRLYQTLKHAEASGLPALKTRLLELSATSSGPSESQMKVLWDAYRLRRDRLRRREEERVAHKLGSTARALINRIQRVRSKPEAAWVGLNLHRSMKGEVQLPGPVTQPEWAVVFAAYRSHKADVGVEAL